MGNALQDYGEDILRPILHHKYDILVGKTWDFRIPYVKLYSWAHDDLLQLGITHPYEDIWKSGIMVVKTGRTTKTYDKTYVFTFDAKNIRKMRKDNKLWKKYHDAWYWWTGD